MLQGVRVIELATVIAAPTCAALLCDMGAEVIKIEVPEGDSFRYLGVNPKTKVNGITHEKWGIGFEQANRGKKSVVLQLKSVAGKENLLALLGTADVFITNVRPKAIEKLNLSYSRLKVMFPALIYGHLTAWGLGGPEEDDPGYDAGAFWAASGYMKYATPNDLPSTPCPRFVGGSGDQNTCMHLLAGILGALYYRKNTGRGQFVEATLYRAGVWTMAHPLSTALAVDHHRPGQRLPAPEQRDFHTPTFNAYPCKDGRWVQLLGLEMPRHIESLLKAVDPTGSIRNQRPFKGTTTNELCSVIRSTQESRHKFVQLLCDIFRKKNVDEWLLILRKGEVWHKKVMDYTEVIHDKNALALGVFTDVGASHKIVEFPIQFSEEQPKAVGRAPRLGEHTAEVLASLNRGKL
jgi:crotonobetainyl-CoA:carnitine CoA-transferase CaiB-like acyl-CoA transferase